MVDLAYSFTLNRRGHSVWHAPCAEVVHYGSRSIGQNPQAALRDETDAFIVFNEAYGYFRQDWFSKKAGCEMDAILDIAARHHLKVVEDCAHAIETTYGGRGAGLLGDAGCFSFYPTKSITTGDGGMVISRHQSLIERVKLLSYNGVATSAWTRFPAMSQDTKCSPRATSTT